MKMAPPSLRRAGFTLVELLLAMTLAILVAGILAALLRGLLEAGDGQSARIRGPVASRAAVQHLARELACAFAPPVKDLVPLRLATSTEPGKPEVRLDFYAPVPAPLGYDIEQVAYEVERTADGSRELRRISTPCSGPFTNAPVTNLLLRGGFSMAIEAVTNDIARADWPPPGDGAAHLPTSLRLALDRPGEASIRTEVLLQTATGIRSPVERKPAEAEEEQ